MMTLERAAQNVPIRALVVDDHPMVRHDLIAILRCEPDIAIVGDAADDEQAALTERLREKQETAR